MSKVKHKYLMANSYGELVMSYPKTKREIGYLKSIIIANFKNVIFLDDNVFTHEVSGKRIHSLLRWVVSSGDLNDLESKRVQISKRNITHAIDDIICLYIFNGAIGFIRSTNPKSVVDLPNNITTLFWFKIQIIADMFKENKSYQINKKTRKVNSKILFSKNAQELYEKELEGYNLGKLNKNIDLENLPFEPDDDYEKLEDNVVVFNDSEIEELMDSELQKEIGRIGEKIVNNLLLDRDSKVINKIKGIKKINWLNEHKESMKPYDFILNDDIYLEVKASMKENGFMLSSNEWDIIQNDTSKKYFLIKVNNLIVKNETYSDISIYTREQLNKMERREIVTHVMKEKNE